MPKQQNRPDNDKATELNQTADGNKENRLSSRRSFLIKTAIAGGVAAAAYVKPEIRTLLATRSGACERLGNNNTWALHT